MAKAITRERDPAEHLKTQEDIVSHLEAALEDGDRKIIVAALEDIARAKGTPSTAASSASAPLRRRFTVAEYYAMADIGILQENDRSAKLSAYARAGISEVWIVTRQDSRIEAYTEPVEGTYSNIRYAAPGESIAPQAFPEVVLEVDSLIAD